MSASRDVKFVGCTRVHGGEPEHDVVLSVRPGVMGPASRSQDADGAELTLDQLREAFDAVVLAIGLPTDADPGVPGGDLPGVLGAGGAPRWLNGDPGECAGRTDSGTLLGGSTAVIGMGNVAMDVDPLARQARHRSRGLGDHGRGIHGGPRRFAPAERTRRRMPGHRTRGGRAVRRGMAAQDSGGSGGAGTASCPRPRGPSRRRWPKEPRI
ncbi:hypothetical protein [Kocuria marina]|uniref:hypothetical protein n=1 Tax=Kocuria marina TaxID=223184 RepID=UPI001EF4163E|nr:hypothetical protein [Kocuria indica]